MARVAREKSNSDIYHIKVTRGDVPHLSKARMGM